MGKLGDVAVRHGGDPGAAFSFLKTGGASMSDDPSILAGTFKSRRMLDQSEKAMEDILAAFELMAERMLDGEMVSPAEMSKTRTALAQVRTHLLQEVNKHEERVLRSRGLVADAPLDLDEIRREIGGSLDRVRAARDPERVS